MGEARSPVGSGDHLRGGILLAVRRWLRRPGSGEGVHAVHHARLLHSAPQGFVLGLSRVVAHGVHGPDEADAAAHLGDAVELIHGKLGVLDREQGGEVEALGVLLGVFVGPVVVDLAPGLGADGVLQPGIGVDVGGNNHHLVDSQDVHVAQTGLGLVGAAVIQVCRLLFREGGLGPQVAYVEGALDVVLQAGTGNGGYTKTAGGATDTLGTGAGVGFAIHD